MASLKVEICLKKKKPPRAQIFRYFRIESRKKKVLYFFKSCLKLQRILLALAIKMKNESSLYRKKNQ